MSVGVGNQQYRCPLLTVNKIHPFAESEFTMEADDTNGFSDLLFS